MGFLDGVKARKALLKHQKRDYDGALADYRALYEKGYIAAAYLLPYTSLLLRRGGEENYLLVKEILRRCEKAPDLNQTHRQDLWMNYAVAQYKLGEMDKALQLLERSHQKAPCGHTYAALGFLYIEAGMTEKALAYNLEAVEYDDEDAVLLDNLAQTYYRLLNDKETARPYFEKAHEIKPLQIDTLYFLALYDEEDGKHEDALEKLETALEGNFSPLNYVNREKVQATYDRIKAAHC